MVSLGNRSEGSPPRSARIPFRARLGLDSLGRWTYRGVIPLEQRPGEGWVVDWSPAVIHPRLSDRTRLARERSLPERADVLDRSGRPLMPLRPVVDVAVEPRRLGRGDLAQVAAAVDVDPSGLRQRVRAAEPFHRVPVITLRRADFAADRPGLAGVSGLLLDPGRLPLAPTSTFARALLGTVRPPTAETLAHAGPYASVVDPVGTSGIQYAYQRRLAGRPAGRVMVVDRDTRGVVDTVHEFRGARGRPLRTSLDIDVQAAAEHALADVPGPSALVALDATTGGVLAAANGPAGTAYNRAFLGRYPPGSTFKVVTTAALLSRGLDPSATVPCPATTTVTGKAFGNDDGLALGQVPFHADFARSCNTAFVNLARDLPGSALREAAGRFGLGGDGWDLGLPGVGASGAETGVSAFPGHVPATPSEVDRAAAAIGQGRVLASPLAMAVVAAGVATGTSRQPALTPRRGAALLATGRLDPQVSRRLRALMREVVTSGSGEALAGITGNPGAKTGTAEFGGEGESRTHAWMVGFRGDVAFAVFLEGGGAGGADAGPVAARFLRLIS